MRQLLLGIVILLVSAGMLYAGGIPDPPTHLTVGKISAGALLQWESSQGAMGYRVYKTADSLTVFARIGQVPEDHFADPMVPPGHTYRYYVTAFNGMGESGPSNEVMFSADSTPPPVFPVGYLAGTVIDAGTLAPVPGANVRFFRTNGPMTFFRDIRTDSLGNYFVNLDSGLYYISAGKEGYLPLWFDNSRTIDSATKVAVAVGDTSRANFALHPVPTPPPPTLVKISGTVVDTSTGLPLKGAYVVALHTCRQLADQRDQEGPEFGSRADMINIPEMGNVWGVVLAARVDSLGQYTLKLPAGVPFVLLSAKLGYVPQFYNHKSTYEEADIVTAAGDTAGFDFSLTPNPVLNNSISGNVKDSSGVGVISRVVLYSYNEIAMTPFAKIDPVRCTVTDTLGHYDFKYLFPSAPVNRYFVKAFPLGFFAPAWYSTDSCGVRDWRGADSVAVHGDVTGIDICVRQYHASGFGVISGNVKLGGDQSGLQGTTVYAVSTSSGNVEGYDVTSDGGSFTIQNLTPGAYQIVADKQGYQANSSPVYSVDASNSYTVSDASISVSDAVLGVSGGSAQTPTAYALTQNYPNPFNPTTEIGFSLPTTSQVTISVYNLLGQRVATLLSGEVNAGSYSVTWNGLNAAGRAVSSGIYFYEMSARSLANSSQYNAVKKMMLIK
jgi:hypothetical protein